MVSVIIPNFNREQVIVETVKDVLKQTYTDLEVIIVDDCSDDRSIEVLGDIQDPRVRIFRQTEHKGQCMCRNYGVQVSNGYYIAFQDSGTFWAEDKLEKQIEKLHSQEDKGLVYCAVEIDDGMGEMCFPSETLSVEEKTIHCSKQLAKGNFIDTPTMLMTKLCFNELGGFDESFSCWEDYDFVIRAAQRYPVQIVNEVLVKSKYFANSVSQKDELLFQTLPLFLQKHKEFFVQNGGAEHLLSDAFNNILLHQRVSYWKLFEECQKIQEYISSIWDIDLLKIAEEAMEKNRAMSCLSDSIFEYRFKHLIDEIHRGKMFYLYGAGNWGTRLVRKFKDIGVASKIKGIVVTEPNGKSELEGIPIISLDHLDVIHQSPILIAVTEKTQCEVYKILCNRDYQNVIFFRRKFWKHIK